ncbi:hypothetical protein TNCV_4215101 [Trichonephila clavipes]|nr:hypothetical protein TNCV_4215101 [Trichonephila clavipes]
MTLSTFSDAVGGKSNHCDTNHINEFFPTILLKVSINVVDQLFLQPHRIGYSDPIYRAFMGSESRRDFMSHDGAKLGNEQKSFRRFQFLRFTSACGIQYVHGPTVQK